MKKLIIVAIIAFLLGIATVVIAENTGTQRTVEHIMNKVWNTTNNSLNIKGV